MYIKKNITLQYFIYGKRKLFFMLIGCFVYLIQLKKNLSCTFDFKAAGRWFSLGPLVSSTNKTDHHDITEILLKVALNKHHQTKPSQSKPRNWFIQNNCNWHLNEIAQFCILFWWNLPWNAIRWIIKRVIFVCWVMYFLIFHRQEVKAVLIDWWNRYPASWMKFLMNLRQLLYKLFSK